MMRTRLLAGLVAAAFVLAGCGEGEGERGEDISDLSAKKILATSKAAAEDADSLTVKGEGRTGTTELVVDMAFTAKTGEGTFTSNDQKIDLLAVGGKVYFRSGPDLYARLGPNAVKEIGDKWILADGLDFAAYAKRDTFVGQLLDPDSTVTKGKPKEVDGVECVSLVTSTGTLYVDKRGGRPIRLYPKGGSGSLAFDYDEVDAPKAPSADEIYELDT